MAPTIAGGDGRNSALTQAVPPANCQNAITSASAIQPEARPARGEKPAPRKATGRVSSYSGFAACDVARSSMLHLALGVDRLFADQRPQLVLQTDQLATRLDPAALVAGHRDGHDLADAAGTARQHHDAFGKPHGFFQIS